VAGIRRLFRGRLIHSSVPDLTQDGMYVLTAFILTPALKFPNHRVESMVRARQERLLEAGLETRRKKGRPVKSLEEKQATKAQNQKRFRASLRTRFNPEKNQ
jgi:transcriptional accessory protein Tex/SPT6